jgi:hypothetical protein
MLSYCTDPSDLPRLEETSGDNSRRTVERFGEREALIAGHRVTGESFDPGQTLAAVAEPCASRYGVPTMFMAEFEQRALEECDLSSLRTRITAGAPCSVELTKPVRARLHMDCDRQNPDVPHARDRRRRVRTEGGRTMSTTIRGAVVDGADAEPINRLAALSGRRAPEGPTLLAEADGELIAAIGLFDRHAIANPDRSNLGLRLQLHLLRLPLRLIVTVYGL